MGKEELFGLRIDEPSADVYKKAKQHFDELAKPIDGFGMFEDMICRIAAIQGSDRPCIDKKALIIMIADTKVVNEGISQTDPSVTLQVARLMGKNESTVGAMTRGYDVDVIPVDVGIDSDIKISGIIDKKIAKGAGNIATEPAMTAEQCLEAIEAGIDMVRYCRERGYDIISTGEMGIGNTTTATTLLCALTGAEPAEVTGRGAGLSAEGLRRKTDVIKRTLNLHKLNNTHKITPTKHYVYNAVTKVGGLDIAALSGVYIGAALYHIPVVIDGMISAVAALAAECMVGGSRAYMIASHTGREKGCRIALERLGLKAVLSADMALGEGTGAVMIFPILDMVMSVYDDGTRFDDTPIDRYERFDK